MHVWPTTRAKWLHLFMVWCAYANIIFMDHTPKVARFRFFFFPFIDCPNSTQSARGSTYYTYTIPTATCLHTVLYFITHSPFSVSINFVNKKQFQRTTTANNIDDDEKGNARKYK